MISINATARTAGFFYLLLILTGIFGMVYVPGVTIAWDDPTKTVSNISTHLFLFKLGVIGCLSSYLCFLALSFCLYRVLKAVNEQQAAMMLVFAVIGVAAYMINTLNHINLLFLLKDVEVSNIPTTHGHNSHVMYLLNAFKNGSLVAQIFTGIWLVLFGWLILESRFLPRILGILLVVAGTGYLLDFFAKFLFATPELPLYITLPGTLGEFGTCLWLLIIGVKQNPEHHKKAA